MVEPDLKCNYFCFRPSSIVPLKLFLITTNRPTNKPLFCAKGAVFSICLPIHATSNISNSNTLTHLVPCKYFKIVERKLILSHIFLQTIKGLPLATLPNWYFSIWTFLLTSSLRTKRSMQQNCVLSFSIFTHSKSYLPIYINSSLQ